MNLRHVARGLLPTFLEGVTLEIGVLRNPALISSGGVSANATTLPVAGSGSNDSSDPSGLLAAVSLRRSRT